MDDEYIPVGEQRRDGEIAALRAQLQQAQEERDEAERKTRWASQFECSVHGTCDWSMVSTAKTCMATLSNGQPCVETLRRGPSPWDEAIKRAEAAERRLEGGGTVMFAGLSVPKRRLDEAKAEHTRRCDDLVKRAERAEALLRCAVENCHGTAWRPEARTLLGLPSAEALAQTGEGA